MKNLLIVDTTWPINSRTERFRASLLKKYSVSVSAWNRGSSVDTDKPNYYILNTNIKCGNRLKKLFSLPKFILHNICVAKGVKPGIIFASHWDSLFCAVIVKFFYNKDVKIIYDCLDLPTSSNFLLLNILKKVESLSLLYTDFVIFASRYYPALYKLKQEHIVFENYPTKEIAKFMGSPLWYDSVSKLKQSNEKIISWIGVVRYPDILCNLIESIKPLNAKLLVFGDGPSLVFLSKYVLSNQLEKKVVFFGRYKQSELPYIYDVTDFVWAAYPTLDFNSIYAISNKYFESSLFSRIPVFSQRTKMAENLIFNKNVLTVNEYDISDITKTLGDAINKDRTELPYMKYELDKYWEDEEYKLLEAMSVL
jgi:hypothetical protein